MLCAAYCVIIYLFVIKAQKQNSRYLKFDGFAKICIRKRKGTYYIYIHTVICINLNIAVVGFSLQVIKSLAFFQQPCIE